MNKKIRILFAVLLALVCVVSLVACQKECKHKDVQREVTKQATCLEEGVATYTCTKCNESWTETISKTGHTLGEVVPIAPGACPNAYVAYRDCSVCNCHVSEADGSILSDGQINGNHAWVQVPAQSATCTQDGNVAYNYCSACHSIQLPSGEITTDETAIVVKAGHVLGEFHAQQQSTCTTAGTVAWYSCANCAVQFKDEALTQAFGENESKALPLAQHSLTTCPEVPATCVEGTLQHQECSACHGLFDMQGNATTAQQLVIPATGAHAWGADVPAQSATCTENGTLAYKECTQCHNKYTLDGQTKLDSIVELAHHVLGQSHPAKPATCTESGNVAWYTCANCDVKFKDEALTQAFGNGESEVVNAKGHDWGNWSVTTPATCTADGEETRICKNDATHTETRPVNKLGHTWVDGVCSVCGKVMTEHAGTQADPYTAEEALAVASGLASGAYSENVVYVTGVVSKFAGLTNKGGLRFELATGQNIDLVVYGADTSYNEQTLAVVGVGDQITLCGYLQNFNGNTPELTFKNDVNPTIVEYAPADQTISVGDTAQATVTNLSATTAKSGTVITFTAQANEGYAIDAVKVNGKSISATEGNAYAFVVRETSLITVETSKEGGYFALVTDASQLTVGSKIVIVAKDSDVAMGEAKTNNFGTVAVTKDTANGTLTSVGAGVTVITVAQGTKDGTIAFAVDGGYLYAASSGSNHLKVQSTLDDNGSWIVTIADGVATIKAQGANTRNWLRYNDSATLFSCYTSVQKDVVIYVQTFPCDHANVAHTTAVAKTCTTNGNVEYWYCSDCKTYFADEQLTEKITVEQTVLEATGHAWQTAWSVDGETGKHYHACDNCNERKDEAEHGWDEGNVTTSATCTANGEKTYTCLQCNATKTEEIPALGHQYKETWSHDASNHWHECSVCGDKKDNEGHTFVDNKCTICERLFECPGHNYQDKYDGTYHYEECTICKDVQNKEQHALYWFVDEVNGTHCQKCSHCNYSTEAVAHNTSNFTEAKPSTCCTAGNVAYYTCDCGFVAGDGKTVIAEEEIVIAIDTENGHVGAIIFTPNADGTTHTGRCSLQDCPGVGTQTCAKATDATWTNGDTAHYYECEVCHRHIDEQNHTPNANYNGKCSVCGNDYLDHAGTSEDPLSIINVNFIASKLDATNSYSAQKYYVKGYYVVDGSKYYIVDDYANQEQRVQLYGIESGEFAPLYDGDLIVVNAYVQLYKGTTVELSAKGDDKGVVTDVLQRTRSTISVQIEGGEYATIEGITDGCEKDNASTVTFTVTPQQDYVAQVKQNGQTLTEQDGAYSFVVKPNTTISIKIVNKYAPQEIDETLDFTTKDYANAQDLGTETLESVTIVFAKNSGSNAPKYYSSNNGTGRVYNGNKVTITSNYSITNIQINADVLTKLSANVGTYENGIWTGSANEIVFSVSGTTKITQIIITYVIVPEGCPHANVSKVDGTPATCEQAGQKDVYTCSACQQSFIKDEQDNYVQMTAQNVVIPQLTHEQLFADATPTTAGQIATCEQAGQKAIYTCTHCNNQYVFDGETYVIKTEQNAIIAQLGHSYDAMESRLEPTCIADGHVAYNHCSLCNKYYDDDEQFIADIVIPKVQGQGHLWGKQDGETFTAGGYNTDETQHWQTCKHCGETSTKVNHTPNFELGFDSNENGTHDAICSICEEIYTENCTPDEEIWYYQDASGHYRECDLCAQKLASTQTAHSWDAGQVTTLATCQTDGTKLFTCTDCGATKTESYSDADAHNFATEWTTDGSQHWHVCLNQNADGDQCTVVSARANHQDDQTWQKDETNHWTMCEVCGYILNLASHSWDGDGNCEQQGCDATQKTISVVVEQSAEQFVSTLQDAFDLANGKNATINLTADISSGEVYTLQGEASNVTLDLNGKTVNASIVNNGTLVITNTASEQAKLVGANGTYLLDNQGALTLQNANVEYSASTTSSASLIRTSKALTINGGSFVANAYTINLVKIEDNAEAVAIINDGQFTNNQYAQTGTATCVLNWGTLTINGGNFTATKNGNLAKTYSKAVVSEANSTATINGGTFGGKGSTVYGNPNSTVTINDGLFEKTPGGTATIKDGYEYVMIGTHYHVSNDSVLNVETSTTYATLQEAVDGAAAGETLNLFKDIELTQSVVVTRNLVINLNRKNINIAGEGNKWAIDVNKAHLTLTGVGTITASGCSSAVVRVLGADQDTDGYVYGVQIDKSVKLVSADGTPYAISVSQNNGSAYGVKVDVYGKLTGYYGAISVNGKINKTEGNVPQINVYNKAELTATNGEDCQGIYVAGYAIVNVDGTVTGGTGIGIKAGQLTVTANAIVTANALQAQPEVMTNGLKVTGDAIQIESNANYAREIVVVISGGTLTSVNGYGIHEYNDGTGVQSINISGGNVSSLHLSAGAKAKTTVIGGTFLADVADYADCVTESEGKYVVHEQHAWTETASTAGDCQTKATKTYVCDHCGATKTDELDFGSHNQEAIAEVPATCTTAGTTAGSKCSICQQVLTAPQPIDALGHSYGKATEDQDQGDHYFECIACGDVQREAHVPSGTATPDANSTTHSYSCDKCNATVSEAHSFEGATLTEDAEANDHYVECVDCGYKAHSDHDFTNGDCACGAQKPIVLSSITLTADKLGMTGAYSTLNVESIIDGVTFAQTGFMKGSNNMQCNTGKGSSIWNTTSLPGVIDHIVVTWSETNANFGLDVCFGTTQESANSKSNTVQLRNRQSGENVVCDGDYTYVYIVYNGISKAQYIASIEIFYKPCDHATRNFVAEVPATCDVAGTTEHYACGCGKKWADQSSATELTNEQVAIAPLGHVFDNGNCTREGCLVKQYTVSVQDSDNVGFGVSFDGEKSKGIVDEVISFTITGGTIPADKQLAVYLGGEKQTAIDGVYSYTVKATDATPDTYNVEFTAVLEDVGTEPVGGQLLATFTLGADGAASHVEGSPSNSYSETVNGYSFTINGTNVYGSARDAQGNGCLKLGTSSKAGSFSFTVSSDVNKVKIYVAKYKTNTTKITINGGSEVTLTSNSNDGAYDVIEIDTSTTKTINFVVSSGNRCMVNTVEYFN